MAVPLPNDLEIRRIIDLSAKVTAIDSTVTLTRTAINTIVATWANNTINQAVLTIITNHDWSQAADDNTNPDKRDLIASAVQAIVDIDSYLAVADNGIITVIQNRDHLITKRLAQIAKILIKRLIQI